MTHALRALLAGLLLATAVSASAAEIGGVAFDERATVAGQELVLNGGGVRTRLLFKVYAMGLYLPSRATSPEAVVSAAGAKRIRIVLLRDLEAKQFADALVEGLQKNHSPAALAALQPSIDALRNALLDMKEAKTGTAVVLDSLPGIGTRLTVDGRQRGVDMADEAFFPALLRIWLGDKPVDGDLKKALLGEAR